MNERVLPNLPVILHHKRPLICRLSAFSRPSLIYIPIHKRAKTQLNMYLSPITAWRRPTLAEAKPQLPSALESLTSVFGMGTGVTSPLLPPDLMSYVNC